VNVTPAQAQALADGSYTVKADVSDASGNGATEAMQTITVDETPPSVNATLVYDTGAFSTDKITNNPTLTGSGDPNAVVHFTVDGNVITATANANGSGIWVFTPSGLDDGVHTIVANETDSAGNTGSASLTFTLDTTPPIPVIETEVLSKGKVSLTGTTAEANDIIAIYDGSTLIGATTTGSTGVWSFTTATVSNAVHTYTATATDVAGNIGHSSNEAILGSSGADILLGTSGNDIIIGNGGKDKITGGLGADTLTGGSGDVTFIYNAVADSTPVSHDTITDFRHGHDKIDFTNIAGINASAGVPTFEGKLTGFGNLILNAHSVAYIEVAGNTEVLVNTTANAEIVTSSNVSAANMEIALVGIHLAAEEQFFAMTAVNIFRLVGRR
jgi:Ca2+-binding RTX toxin-like protein